MPLPAKTKGNSVAKTGGFAARFQANQEAMTAAAGEYGGGDVTYVKFDGNNGEFTVLNEAGDELDEGTRVVLNLDKIEVGYICWKDGEVVDRLFVPYGDEKPAKHTLPDHGPYEKYPDGTEDGWTDQVSMPLITNEGEEMVLNLSSASGLRAFGGLMKQIGKLYAKHLGEFPIIELGSNSFVPKKNKKAGTKYAPTFTISEWIDQEEALASVVSTEGDEDDPSNYEEGAGEPEDEADAGEPEDEGEGDPEDQGAEAEETEEEEEAPPAPAAKARPAKSKEAPPEKAAVKPGRRGKRF